MLEKLNPKDIRALKLGAVGIVVIIGLILFWNLNEHWAKANESYQARISELDVLDALDMTKAKYARLKSTVPVFEMPLERDKQKFRFQDSLNEQFKKANVKSQPWEETGCKGKILTGYDVLTLKTSGKCNVTQLFDLLVRLKENPYLMGIEELSIKSDEKNKQQVNFDITVSTPVKHVKSRKSLL